MEPAFLASVLTIALVVLWYLLRQKDNAQQESITLLFTKYDVGAKELQDLKIQIAKDHYVKPELDAKFEKLETAIDAGFKEIARKLDGRPQ